MPWEAAKIAGRNPSVLRRANATQVFHAIRLHPNISQRQISTLTGIDKSTVSTIINDFNSLSLVSRLAEETPRKPGRPSEALVLNPDAGLLIGVHIVPDEVVLVASGLDGVAVATTAYPPIGSASDVGASIEKALRTFLNQIGKGEAQVRSIGVSVPGLINERGRLAESSNMKWHDLELRAALAQRLGQSVWVSNDARAAALAEKLFGSCVDVDDYVYIESASGVGGALYTDGAIYSGAGGFAGELGHCKVVPLGRLCACGASGCLSAYVSGPALQRRFAAFGLAATSFDEMKDHAARGSEAASVALEEAGEVLGIALSNFINLFNPPTIVLGGGLAVLAQFLLPAAKRALQRHTLATSLHSCRILVSQLALESVPRGALAVALDGLSQLTARGPFPW